MEDNNTLNEPLKLEKAYTFFMIPFYYEGNWDDIHKKISRWEPQKEEMYKEDILYPYIMELFKQAQPKENDSPTNRLKIYQLRTRDIGSKSEFFFDRVLGKKHVAIFEENSLGQKKPYAIPYVFHNDGNNAPHLFISPSAQIGIMTICTELADGCTIQDLRHFNYFLQKRNEIDNVFVGKKILPNGEEKEIKDKRTTNYRLVCPSPETNKSLSYADAMNAVAQYLNPEGYKKLINEEQNINNEHVNWDLNYFIGFLLNTLGWKSQVNYFNRERIHIYTFCSIDGTESTGCQITSDDIVPEALRLSRVVNSKYLLPFDEMVQKGAIMQTYQNIYFSSSIEGTSIICIARDINKSFIDDMKDKFNRQYLLIYLLVLLQRYTLLSIDRRLTEYDARNDGKDDGLWNLINLICKIKVNCYYTDVSIYTHHSQFYQHCCRNLHVPETFEEIDEKVELLKLTTDRKMHLLMEAQRKIQEDEAKRHQEEIERIKKKEAENERRRKEEQVMEEARQKQIESQLKQEKDEAERRQHILNGIVGVLTIAQVMQATYELMKPEYDKDQLSICTSVVLGIVCFILLVALMWKDIVKFIKK